MMTGWAAAQTTPMTALLALSKQDHTLATDLATLRGSNRLAWAVRQ
jgi:hypothetical protein